MPGWDEVFGTAPPEVQAIAEGLRDEILRQFPGCVMTARPGDGAVTFGSGPRKMLDGCLYLAPQRGRVNLGFYHGASLADPAGLLEGTGKALRHVKVTGPEPSPALVALIGAALERHKATHGV